MASKKLIIQRGVLSEVYKLAPHLRLEDKKEIKKAGFKSIVEGLKDSFNSSFIVRSVYEENKIIGMYGAVIASPNYYKIWFLGSCECEKYPVTFIKEGKKFINELLKIKNLFNYVYKKNIKHIEFLERLGFIIEPSILKNFYVFYKLKEM